MTLPRPRRIFQPSAPGSLLKRIGEATPAPRKAETDNDPAYLALVRQCPCLYCGMEPSEAAHVRMASAAFGKASGLGKKPPNKFCLPLCAGCHRLAQRRREAKAEMGGSSRPVQGRNGCRGRQPENLNHASRASRFPTTPMGTTQMPRPAPLNPIDKHIGARLRMRRNDLKISQERLADMLNISFQQIQKYEKAMNRVSASRLVKIAELLEVDVEFFYPAKKGNGHGVVNTRMDTFMASQDGLIIANAFVQIKDPEVRRIVAKSVATLAEMAGALVR